MLDKITAFNFIAFAHRFYHGGLQCGCVLLQDSNARMDGGAYDVGGGLRIGVAG